MKRWPLIALAFVACEEDAATIDPDQPPVTGTCQPSDGDSDPYIDCVDEVRAADGASFGHDALPDIVLGPPMGAQSGAGGVDVASLGCGGSITVMFDGEGIVDGDGVDLRVFENAFSTGASTFAEPARVLVSADGQTWHAFPCELAGEGGRPPVGCAGVQPVEASATDPARAGGDGFDLADVDLPSARWLRLVDVTETHYGDRMWCTGAAAGFDLDAAAALPAEER